MPFDELRLVKLFAVYRRYKDLKVLMCLTENGFSSVLLGKCGSCVLCMVFLDRVYA